MRHDRVAAATVGRSLISQTALLAGGGPVTSVLICDDRPGVIPGLTEMLRPLPALTALDWVPDGFALLDAVTTKVGVVLIGIHHGSGTGVEAVTLLLSMHPSMVDRGLRRCRRHRPPGGRLHPRGTGPAALAR